MSITNENGQSVLDAAPFGLNTDQKTTLFYKNLLQELSFHYENNGMYRKFCDKQNFYPQNYDGALSGIPAIPVHVFKALGGKLSSVSQSLIVRSLQSSATSGVPSTIVLDKITSKRQTRAMARVMAEVLGPKRRLFCVMDIDPSGPNRGDLGARLAAVNGYLNFASTAKYFVDSSGQDSQLEFLDNRFVDYINNLQDDVPIVIFGFTFVLYHTVFRCLKMKGITLKLPKGSQVIHIGGWKKLEANKVDKETFNADISKVLGIPVGSVVDIYGFTEQMGLNYPDCAHGWKHIPVYSEVLVRNETDLSVNADGTPGLLEFLSPLQHSYPGNVVLTDDIGVVKEGLCACGREGRRFKVLGRAEKAEIRGCGEIMAEKVVVPDSKSDNRKPAQSMDIFHAPMSLCPEKSPLEQLEDIFITVKRKQSWLTKQPTEALIGLIDAARSKWAKDERLDIYRAVGLNFLSSWCEPARITSLLDAGLHGRRGHLDNFLPRVDITHSSLKALPRGVVCHWLSGNVPLLGMFALIQSIVSKNANVIKVSAGESQALPFVLSAFEGLYYTTL